MKSSALYRDRFVRLGRLKCHYTDWGSKRDPAVIMIHGLNVECHSWDPIAKPLSSMGLRVICPDLRGHGDSDWARDGYTLDQFCADVDHLAVALDLPEIGLVGHSLGGRVAILMASRRPQLVRRMVLSDTGPEVSRQAAINVRDRALAGLQKRGYGSASDAMDEIRTRQPSWQPEFHELYVKYQYRRNWVDKLVSKADPELFWLTGSASSREEPGLWNAWKTSMVPTLLLWGRESFFLDGATVKQMTDSRPDVQVVTFECGHYLSKEKPEDFNKWTSDFLMPRGISG